MADHKKWFKVWTSLLTDPEFDDMPNWCIGVWVRLGALVAQHGENGKLSLSKQQFLKRANITENDLLIIGECLSKINVKVEIIETELVSLSYDRWSKYQVDWGSYERVKKFRETLNETTRETVQNKIKNKKKNIDKEKKIPTTLPKDFCISERVSLWAEKKGFRYIEEHLESFKNRSLAKGYKYIDWDAAFMEAIRTNWAKIENTAITPLDKSKLPYNDPRKYEK